MKDLVIVGSGGFAREVKWLIDECNLVKKEWNFLGWISEEIPGTMIDDFPVLGNDEWLINYKEKINTVISVGNGLLREKIVNSYKANCNISFPNIIAPDVLMSKSVKLGYGCIIAAHNVLTVNISIGNFFISNLGCTIGHDCEIDSFVTLYPGAHVSGNVKLERNVSIGTGASIIQGLSVGENTFVGAGAAVVKNLPKNCIAVGVPAKPLIK